MQVIEVIDEEVVETIDSDDEEDFDEEYSEEFDEEDTDVDSNIQEIEEDIPYEEDDQAYEMEEEEESLFGNIKSIRNTREVNMNLDMLEQLEKKSKPAKKGIFKSLMKMNSKNEKKIANE